jgi:thiol-disulfide isomerase/thioredoxin
MPRECVRVRIDTPTGPVVGHVTVEAPRRRRCSVCKVAWSTRLCDWPKPTAKKPERTCSKPLCDGCRRVEGEGDAAKDFCPTCPPLPPEKDRPVCPGCKGAHGRPVRTAPEQLRPRVVGFGAPTLWCPHCHRTWSGTPEANEQAERAEKAQARKNREGAKVEKESAAQRREREQQEKLERAMRGSW